MRKGWRGRQCQWQQGQQCNALADDATIIYSWYISMECARGWEPSTGRCATATAADSGTTGAAAASRSVLVMLPWLPPPYAFCNCSQLTRRHAGPAPCLSQHLADPSPPTAATPGCASKASTTNDMAHHGPLSVEFGCCYPLPHASRSQVTLTCSELFALRARLTISAISKKRKGANRRTAVDRLLRHATSAADRNREQRGMSGTVCDEGGRQGGCTVQGAAQYRDATTSLYAPLPTGPAGSRMSLLLAVRQLLLLVD